MRRGIWALLLVAPLAAALDVAGVRAQLAAVGESVAAAQIEPQWLGDTHLAYVHGGALHELTLANRAQRTLVTLAQIEQTLPTPAAVSSVTLTPDRTTIEFRAAERLWRLRLGSAHAVAIEPAELAQRVLDGPRRVRSMFPIEGWNRLLVSFEGPNLALRRRGEAALERLTNDGDERSPWFTAGEILVGQASPFAPDGRRVVVRQLSSTGVRGVLLLDGLSDHGERASRFRYWPRVGEPIPANRFALIDLREPERPPHALALDAALTDHWLSFLSWDRRGREIWVAAFSRDFSTLELHAIDPVRATSRRVWRDARSDGHVLFPFTGFPIFALAADDRHFVLWSDRDGRFALWRHDARSGAPIARLHPPQWLVHAPQRVDPAGRFIDALIALDPERPHATQVVRVALDGAQPARILTPDPGEHALSFSPNGEYFVDFHHSTERAPRSTLHRADGQRLKLLARTPVASDAALAAISVETTVVELPEGPVSALILKPPGFDPSGRYPVIERRYGGMQDSAIPRGYRGRRPGSGPYPDYVNQLTIYALHGFAVVVFDAPGSPGRDRAYNMATYRRWPLGIAESHRAALLALAQTRPWLDLERLGIDANSWGGMTALDALTRFPEQFNAAVLTVPQTDPTDHLAWMEFQLGTLASNPTGYAQARVLDRLDALKIAPLIIAGTSDGNVPFSNTLKLLDRLATLDRPYELVLLPSSNHALQRAPQPHSHTAYAVARALDYFERTLKPKRANSSVTPPAPSANSSGQITTPSAQPSTATTAAKLNPKQPPAALRSHDAGGRRGQ
jgi:dipeptidyl-peptidase 4